MAKAPFKFVRFLVWVSTDREYRDDALIALDEGFEEANEKFGLRYAHCWSISQALRSLPFGAFAVIAKVGSLIIKLVS